MIRFAELLANPIHQEVSEIADELRRRLGPYVPGDAVDAELRRLDLDPSSERARMLLAEFLPLVDIPAVETTRQRTLRVGARLETEAAVQPPTPATEAASIVLSIDGGHVRSVRSYQVRSFEIFVAQVSNDDGQ